MVAGHGIMDEEKMPIVLDEGKIEWVYPLHT